jgi:hypothetical protein
MNRLLLEYIDSVLMETSPAATQAKAMGLKYMGFGKWGKGGVVTHKNVDKEGSSLVQYSAPAKKSATKKSVDKKKSAVQATTKGKTSTPTRGDEIAVLSVIPDAQEIVVIDEIDLDSLQSVMNELGIDIGDTTLSPDMKPIEDGYTEKSLSGEYSDEKFYERMKKSGLKIREPLYQISPEFREQLKSNGFPEQYIQLIERSVNVERKGDEPKFTDMLSGAGAGANRSQFGEIMSMAMIALPPEFRVELQKDLAATIGTPSQQRKAGLFDPVADISWGNAAIGHAMSFDTHMNELYGEGQWRLDGTAWDRRSDIESLGLEYKNKGFSTDIVLRVQPLDENSNAVGPAQAQRASLKKDEKVMLFNGGIGEIKGLVRQAYLSKNEQSVYEIATYINVLLNSKIPEEKRRGLGLANKFFKEDIKNFSEAKTKIADIKKKLDERAKEKSPEKVKNVLDRVENFTETQKSSSIQTMIDVMEDDVFDSLDEKQFTDAIESTFLDAGDRRFARKAWDTLMSCKSEGVSPDDIEKCMATKMSMSASDRLSKMGTFIGRIAATLDTEKYSKKINDHLGLATDLGKEYLSLFSSENPGLLAGLMGVLAEKFPLNVTMSGTEFMVINGIHIGPSTLKTMFGVDSYEELHLGLKILSVDDEPVLAYQAESGGTPVVIGLVDARQRGRGYSSIAFEIKCAEEFFLRAGIANQDNGSSSETNDEAVARVGNRMLKRKKQ